MKNIKIIIIIIIFEKELSTNKEKIVNRFINKNLSLKQKYDKKSNN